MQVFDERESLGAAVAAYLHAGLLAGDAMLVVSTPSHLQAIAHGLEQRGCPMRPLIEARAIVVLDAYDTLGRLLRNGPPTTRSLDEVAGSLVRRLVRESRAGVRIYGEMVDVLAGEGDFAGAEQLESLWNDVARSVPVHLFCGYLAAHFAGPDAGDSLGRLCRRHTRVERSADDTLASWLLERQLGR